MVARVIGTHRAQAAAGLYVPTCTTHKPHLAPHLGWGEAGSPLANSHSVAGSLLILALYGFWCISWTYLHITKNWCCLLCNRLTCLKNKWFYTKLGRMADDLLPCPFKSWKMPAPPQLQWVEISLPEMQRGAPLAGQKQINLHKFIGKLVPLSYRM